jgi:hypothetical protein
MGTSSQLNGLTNWIDNNIQLEGDPFKKSDVTMRWNQAIDITIKYGRSNIKDFRVFGDPVKAAEYVAKWVNNDKDLKVTGFLKFTQWVFKHYSPHHKQNHAQL